MDLKQIGCDGVNWIHITQDMIQSRALGNTVMYLRLPWNVESFWTQPIYRQLLKKCSTPWCRLIT